MSASSRGGSKRARVSTVLFRRFKARKVFSSRAWRGIILFLLALTLLNCGGKNFFDQFANKKDNPSLYRAALNALNAGQYSAAIGYCDEMSADFLAQAETAYLCASAYAGRCGYTMTSIADILSTYNPSSDPLKLFHFFMTKYHNSTADTMSDCAEATSLLRDIGPASVRSDDHNYMLILMGLTHIGVIMNALADSNMNGGSTANDDIPDGDFNSCDPNDMTDAQVSQLGVALWEIARSAEAINSGLLANLKSVLTDISSEINGIGAQYNFLSASADPDAFTADQLKAIRLMVKEGEFVGLNYCADLTTCLLTCP